MSVLSNSARIAALNDAFRKDFAGGKLIITAGVLGSGGAAIKEILKMVRDYSDFDPDNDPYGEHDFGSIDIMDETFFWKIDYYDRSMAAGSEDPADPSQTIRVITIMLAEEY